MDETHGAAELSWFEEPADFRPKTPPNTFHRVKRRFAQPGELEEISLELVGHHSLWAHCLWNAGVVLGEYFDEHRHLVKDKRVLEFGAAAAVPSFIAALNGASLVMITEYPEASLVNSIIKNAERNVPDLLHSGNVFVKGFLWGKDPSELLSPASNETYTGYDVLVLSDLVFNHLQHHNLLKSCVDCLRPDGQGQVFVTFTSHRPWLADKDMNFLTLAVEEPYFFKVEQVYEIKTAPMFPDDPGDVDIRSTIHCFKLTRSSTS